MVKYRALVGRARAGRSYAGDYIFNLLEPAVADRARAGASRASVYHPLFERLKKRLQS